MSLNKEAEASQETSLRRTLRDKVIHEAVITDTYYGFDTVEVKSLGFFEEWFDAAKTADNYVNHRDRWHWPPFKWKIKQHTLHRKQGE